MEIYFQNGTMKKSKYMEGNDNEFYVQVLDSTSHVTEHYIYPGNELNYELDSELVTLYDKLRDTLFVSVDEYYKQCCSMPIFVQSAGQDSESSITASQFQELLKLSALNNNLCIDLYRHLYLVDCQYLVGTIQNLLSGMEDAFINYFIKICGISSLAISNPDTTYFVMSQSVRNISSLLESYFTKAYSILDMFCKLAYELEYPMLDFSKYRKLKSAKLLWGDKKKLSVNRTAETIFERCDSISSIESLRNEVVHNGSWELNPKAFIVVQQGIEVERFMLFPDIKQGHLTTVKNRNHFFGNGVKVNDLLPEIHNQFLKRVLKTAKILNGL